MSRAERAAPVGTILNGRKAKRNDWQTPEHVLERVRLLAPGGWIAFDPASAPDNPTRALRYCAPLPPGARARHLGTGGEWWGEDGLAHNWRSVAQNGLVYCNPPYGSGANGHAWLAKIAAEARRGVFVVALLGVARTEQPYMADTVLSAANAVCFVRGRISFRNPDTGDLVSGGCYASWLLGCNVPSLRLWREALEPLAGTESLMDKGARSLCVEWRAL